MKEKQLAWDFNGEEIEQNDYDYNLDIGDYSTEWFNIMLDDSRFRVIRKENISYITIEVNFSYYTKGNGNLIDHIEFFITNLNETTVAPIAPYPAKLNIWADYRDHNITYNLLFPVENIDIRDDLRFTMAFYDQRYHTYVRKSYILVDSQWLEDELVAFKLK